MDGAVDINASFCCLTDYHDSNTHVANREIELVHRALDETLRTVERRVRLYRKIVIIVFILMLLAAVAAVFRSLAGAGIVLAVAVASVAAYIQLDTRQVNRWKAFMQSDGMRALNRNTLLELLRRNAYAPPATISGMFAALDGRRASNRRH
jgi:hypothetical protein